jgi:lipid-A-disaccharide synthase
MTERSPGTLRICLVAAEQSGDRLGAALMRALRSSQPSADFVGVGGHEMLAEGLHPLVPVQEFAFIGWFDPISNLLPLHRYIRDVAQATVAAHPDVLVIIDSPGLTHEIAKRVRRQDRAIPIVNYVSPSVWAWRPGRAKKMRAYVDHVMALLPFEPAAHARLGGPPCTYVGHPLIEQIDDLRPNAAEAARRNADPPVLLVLPGSRSREISLLLGVFGDAINRLRSRVGAIEVAMPTVPRLEDRIRAETARWPLPPKVLVEPEEKRAAFRTARAALAKSGTVTLEVALAGVPMITAYKISIFDEIIARMVVQVPTIILTNLVLGMNAVPEILQRDCTAQNLADALAPLLGDTAQRRSQIEAFKRLDEIMEIGRASPSRRAADIVLRYAKSKAQAVASVAAVPA